MPGSSLPAVKDPRRVARARRRLNSPPMRSVMDAVQRAFCEPARLRIVRALEDGELCVGDLAVVIGRTHAGTSQHLRVLRSLGVVEGVRRSNIVYYRLREGTVATQLRSVLDAVERTMQTAS
jgi:DNA-binding transcriptional ArsR family regulator